MLTRTEKIRSLKAEELGVSPHGRISTPSFKKIIYDDVPEKINEDDPVLLKMQELLQDGYAGIILAGAPGTGKSRHARLVANFLADYDSNRVLFAQFHPGYQYEDFIESYVPNSAGGFDLRPKVFLKACEIARALVTKPVVLVIDEFSRTDVIRVFGEALTYLEQTKREIEFTLASGQIAKIPKNLIVIATMNPWDRGVEDLDLALERRFAKIIVSPNLESLRQILVDSKIDDQRKLRLEQFFQMISNHRNVLCRIGHAYFQTAKSDDALTRLWEHQLSFHFARVLKNDSEELSAIHAAWQRIFSDQ